MPSTHKMIFLTIGAVLLLQACTPAVQTTPMAVDKTRYNPAVGHYPASVGVYFPADFFDNNFYHETNDGRQHTFHNNPADATRQALVLAFEKTFAEVRYLDTLQEGLDADDLAFVIVPNIVSMVADLAPEVIAVMLVYQFDFFADGELLHSWRISGVDSVSRKHMKMPASFRGSTNRDVRQRAISPDRFDAVARRAVWDATSVLLSELDQQSPLTDRLPTSVVNGATVGLSQMKTTEPIVLAMVGPIFDQGQVPEKKRLEACLIEEITDNGLSIQAMSLHHLRDQLYPWLSRSNYPRRLNEMELIVKEPAVRERLQELGVKYVLYWDGRTTSAQFEGPFYVTAYGVFGYESSDKTSTINADLLSVEDGKVVTSFETIREGTDLLLGLALFPVPIVTDTEEDACEEITRQIDTFLQANTKPQTNRR